MFSNLRNQSKLDFFIAVNIPKSFFFFYNFSEQEAKDLVLNEIQTGIIKSEPISTSAPIPTPALHASHAAAVAVANITHSVAAMRHTASSLTPNILSTSPKLESCFEAAVGHLPTAVTPVLSTNSSSSSSNNNNNGYISQATTQQQQQQQQQEQRQQSHHSHTSEQQQTLQHHNTHQHHQHQHHHQHHHNHHHQHHQQDHNMQHHHGVNDLMETHQLQQQQENLSYTQLYPVNESSLVHDIMPQYPDNTSATTTSTAYYTNNNYFYDATVDVTTAASLIRPFSANSNSCSSSTESERQLSTGNASNINGNSPQTTYSDLSHSFELNYFSDSSSHQHHHHNHHQPPQQQQQQQQQHHLQHSTLTELTSPLQGHHLTQLEHQQTTSQHHSLSHLDLQQPSSHNSQQQPQHIAASSFTESFKDVNGPHYTSVIVEPQHYNEFVH